MKWYYRQHWVFWLLSDWYYSLTAHQHQKGHTVPKTGDNDCNVNSSHYSLRTALCESICYQAKSGQIVRQDPIPRVRHGEAAHAPLDCWELAAALLPTVLYHNLYWVLYDILHWALYDNRALYDILYWALYDFSAVLYSSVPVLDFPGFSQDDADNNHAHSVQGTTNKIFQGKELWLPGFTQ